MQFFEVYQVFNVGGYAFNSIIIQDDFFEGYKLCKRTGKPFLFLFCKIQFLDITHFSYFFFLDFACSKRPFFQRRFPSLH